MAATNSISKLVQRDGAWCHYCGYEVRNLNAMSLDRDAASRDHIVPRALGGRNAIENLRIAHKFCNSVRALGFDSQQSMRLHEKHRSFVSELVSRGYKQNPKYNGPVNHTIPECPPHLDRAVKSRSLFFTLGPIAFDIRHAPGRYSHVRVSIGSKHLVGAGYLNEK